jgi:hypothetical protein
LRNYLQGIFPDAAISVGPEYRGLQVSYNNCTSPIFQLKKNVHYLPVAHHNYPALDEKLTAQR